MKIAKPRPGEPIRLVLSANGTPRYRVRLDAGKVNGKRRQVWTTHDTLTSARAHVAGHRADRERGVLMSLDRTNRATFAEFAEAWVSGREASGKIRPGTASGYRHALKQPDAIFGGKQLVEVTETDVEAMVRAIADAGLTRRTASLSLFVVRAVLKEALRRKVIGRNPAEFVEASGKPSAEREALTNADLARLSAHLATDLRFGLWLLTLLGLRRSELMALRWGTDLDLDVGRLTISRSRVNVDAKRTAEGPTKTRKGTRTLPLPADVLTALRELQEAQRESFGAEQAESGYLAVDDVGQPLRPERWTDLWREHCKTAGVAPVSLHGARHSAVTTLRDAGVADHIVAAFVGHDEVTMRRTYSHAHPDEMAAAGEAIWAALGTHTEDRCATNVPLTRS